MWSSIEQSSSTSNVQVDEGGVEVEVQQHCIFLSCHFNSSTFCWSRANLYSYCVWNTTFAQCRCQLVQSTATEHSAAQGFGDCELNATTETINWIWNCFFGNVKYLSVVYLSAVKLATVDVGSNRQTSRYLFAFDTDRPIRLFLVVDLSRFVHCGQHQHRHQHKHQHLHLRQHQHQHRRQH